MAKSKRPEQTKRNPLVTIGILIVVALIAFFVWQNGSVPGLQPEPESASTTQEPAAQMVDVSSTTTAAVEHSDDTEADTTETVSVQADAPPISVQQVSDLPPIAYDELPPEAHDTIELIDSAGPYPFDKDGSTFQNREGILPNMPQGYYTEFTVVTPGSDDRGARRIVAGEDGELYYTDDHYASFKEIIR